MSGETARSRYNSKVWIFSTGWQLWLVDQSQDTISLNPKVVALYAQNHFVSCKLFKYRMCHVKLWCLTDIKHSKKAAAAFPPPDFLPDSWNRNSIKPAIVFLLSLDRRCVILIPWGRFPPSVHLHDSLHHSLNTLRKEEWRRTFTNSVKGRGGREKLSSSALRFSVKSC